MITGLDELESGLTLDADICIIGAGAAGLTLAREFLNTNTHVVVIEGGSLRSTSDNQHLFDGDVVRGGFRGLKSGRSRAFGGTTTLWGGQCIPLDPIDFEHRPWVPHSGWPLSYAALAPFYRRAQDRMGIGCDEYAPNLWNRFGLDQLPFDAQALHSVHGVFIRKPDFRRRYRSELAAAKNIRVLLQANVMAIGTNAYATSVSHVSVRSLGGRTATVRARKVVLCAGGLENARLLLLSDAVCPGGLGNSHDLVGRFLQDHPCGRTAVIRTKDPRRLQDHFNMLYGRAANYLPKLALSDAAQRRTRALGCVGRLAYGFTPNSGAQALRDLLEAAHSRRWPSGMAQKAAALTLSAPELAEAAWRRFYRGLSPAPVPAQVFLETFAEQTPDPQSRVMLSRRTDALGLRQIKVDWRLDELTGHTMRVFTHQVDREFSRLGLGTVLPFEWLETAVPQYLNVLDSYHPAGTTRMADSSRDGVTDANGEVFGVSGLYATGSSVFPTSGAANPTLTIVALAVRLADHLKQVLHPRIAPSYSAAERLLAPVGAG